MRCIFVETIRDMEILKIVCEIIWVVIMVLLTSNTLTKKKIRDMSLDTVVLMVGLVAGLILGLSINRKK